MWRADHTSNFDSIRDFGAEDRLVDPNALRRDESRKYENAALGGREVREADLIKIMLIVEAGPKSRGPLGARNVSDRQ